MEAQEFLDSGCYENNLYQVDRMSLEDTKEKMNDVSARLNANTEIHKELKS